MPSSEAKLRTVMSAFSKSFNLLVCFPNLTAREDFSPFARTGVPAGAPPAWAAALLLVPGQLAAFQAANAAQHANAQAAFQAAIANAQAANAAQFLIIQTALSRVEARVAASRNTAVTTGEQLLYPVPTDAGVVVPNFPLTRGDLLTLTAAQIAPLLNAYQIAPAGGTLATRLDRNRRALAMHVGLRL